MTNNKYIRGANYERELVNAARNQGMISFRAAGSKSGPQAKIDVIMIDVVNKDIYILQCKTGEFPDSEKQKIESDLKRIEGVYKVHTKVMVK